ncbi:MAG: T9SS type A sorting domain-containing protein [Maribacter sp.]|uniref:T9SS type A sorting domain-containing protein n=1 Tax=Maribacter sp. TaxID=1897614 RepID=UPI003298CD94
MKTKLLKSVFGSVLLVGMLTFSFQGQAQDLKTTHDETAKNGRAVYKQGKIYDSKTGPTDAKAKRIADRALDRLEYERQLIQNPFTKEIPESIKLLEAEFSDKILERSLESEASKKSSEMSARSRYSYWKNRGPGNVGGRTRALALDRRDENIVFAGGVSGGLWRSTNLGQSWKKVTRLSQSPSITAIVQDPRKNRSNVWYYASGERYGNSASAGGAFYTGTGIYKSVNKGRSWFPLRDSNDNDLTSITSLDIINSIAIDPATGDLYAATFDGLFRSKKARGEFEQILPSAFDSQTEVMITPNGKIYATVDIFGAENAGFYVLGDDDVFVNITPENIVPAFGRTVMAYDPSDENRIYFFSYNAADFSEAFLWRYQADAETPEEQWVDLSANLPTTIGGPVGNLNLQGAYNMVIKVHPTNPDLIFLGGTNLYRSTDGFTTPIGAESWIGGYNTTNDITLYPNQHPDQHNLVFLPSDPNRAVSSHDGGLSLTDDITNTDRVEWTSLNNKYITTQPYAISFDPEANSDDLLAGFQDNSTWFTNSKSIDEPWVDQFSGDGAYNAIADGGLTQYVSAQGGFVYRLNFDEAGAFVSFTRVQPAGATGFSFIAPFILDPVNDNIMYMPAGDRMWRNSNLDEIPLFSNAPASVNWSELTQTATPDQSQITALDVSKFPIANRLYYGTSSGMIFKMENANIDDQEAIDISTGKGLPPGNVNNIYVDPKNPDRVFAVFSNYGIPSVFVTRNAGDTWKDISGNLEENKDGTGNGPSVRWFAMNGNNDGYFVGTSTGLYFTYKLQGKNTRWYREPLRIGNGVVTQVKTRSDGFVAAGVHGNGVYSANFYVRERPEPNLSVAYLLADRTVPINSDPFEVDITGLFVNERKRREINIELTNSNPELIAAELDGNTLKISIIAADTEGSAAIGLIATSGKEQVSEGFTVNVLESAIYQQVDPISSSSPSQFFTDFGALAQSADDFIVPEGSSWKVREIVAYGAANNGPQLTDATVVIYADNNGAPGQEIYNSGSIVPTSEPLDTNLQLELPEVVELSSGSYWLSVYTNLAFGANQEQWFWFTQANVIGNEAAFKDEFDLFGTGATDWTAQSVAFVAPPEDMVFQIFGMVNQAGEEETVAETARVLDAPLGSENLAEVETNIITTVWPNPSSSEFFFSLKDNPDARVSTRVYNIIGQLVYEKSDIDATRTFSWDASGNPTGLYLVKISGANTNKSFSIVKR